MLARCLQLFLFRRDAVFKVLPVVWYAYSHIQKPGISNLVSSIVDMISATNVSVGFVQSKGSRVQHVDIEHVASFLISP